MKPQPFFVGAFVFIEFNYILFQFFINQERALADIAGSTQKVGGILKNKFLILHINKESYYYADRL